MSALPLTITTAGLAALVNAQNTGGTSVVIAQLGLSPTALAVTAATAAIPDEIKRLDAVAGEVVADDTIHVSVSDKSADAYVIRTIGLYLNTGVLFAAYSQAAPIAEKAAAAMVLLDADIKLSAPMADLIEFTGGGWTNPPATEGVAGVLRLATEAEAAAGVNHSKAVTPKGLKGVIAALVAAVDQSFTDVATALNGKAATVHQHDAGDITSGVFNVGRIPALAMEKITGLAAALAGKLNIAGGDVSGALRVGVGSGLGYLVFARGAADRPGYIEFFTPDNVRRGYIGFSDGGGAPSLQIISENGWNWRWGTRPYFGGNTPWDSGNFNPDLKANVSNPNFAGEVRTKGTGAIYLVEHRDAASRFAGFYATGGDLRLWDSIRGDVIQFSETDVYVRVNGVLSPVLHTGNLDLWWPAGEPKLFIGQSIPPGARLLVANGAAVSRTTYARLFAVIGTLYGAGDGATTFNVPDLRGVFYRAADMGRGVDAGRTIGSYQESQNKSHTHQVGEGERNAANNYTFTGYASGDDYTNVVAGYSTTTAEGGTEARPRNVAFLPCITY